MIMWKFSASVSNDRISALLMPSTIEAISRRIANEMEFLCSHHDPCKDHADFAREIYCIRVPEELFDIFFNSPHGYRGAYFRSPGEGMDANMCFIQTLAPKLIEMSALSTTPSKRESIRESLLSNSAKAWLAENGNHFHSCPKCEGEWGTPQDTSPEIINGRWDLSQESLSQESLSKCGNQAPRFTKIRIFGAFLDNRNNEFIPDRKRNRSRDINMYGWS